MTDRRRPARGVRGAAARVRNRIAPGTAEDPAEVTRPEVRPEVTREHTHLGHELDEAVFRATSRLKHGADPDYDLVRENLDVLHYFLQAPRAAERAQVDVVENFFENGLEFGRSPHPDFAMGAYLARYPERAQTSERSPYLEWLKRGRDAGEVADPAAVVPEMAGVIGLPVAEVVDRLQERRADVIERLRTGVLGEMVNRAAEIEPLISQSRLIFTRPRLLPFGHPTAMRQVATIHAAHEAAGFRTARLVLVVDRAHETGGRRLEGHLAHALAHHVAPEDIVVVYTDDSGAAPADRFPAGVREIDFHALARTGGPVEYQLEDDIENALVVLLRTFRADAIVNVGSDLFYSALRSFGLALTASERVFLAISSTRRTVVGVHTGDSLRYFYRWFERIAGVVTDNDQLARELAETYRIPAQDRDRIHVVRAPVDPGTPAAQVPTGPDRRPQVFWAGSWGRHRRIGLFLQVVRQMPDVDFRMWGIPPEEAGARQLPPNLVSEGVVPDVADLPFDEADAWLYTAAWDGVPEELLEAGARGLPVVGTLVGGTGDVLVPGEAWPVADGAGAEEYVAALRAVLADPEAARGAAARLRDRLLTEHSEADLAGQVADLLLRHRDETVGEVVGS